MKKQVWTGLIVMACSASVGLLAQTTSSSQRSSSQSAANQITVTGCIQRASATPGATGTTGTTGASSTEPGFILANASTSGSSSSSTTTAAGATTTAGTPAGTAGANATYRLDADSSKLTPHVGHKVEITGTLESASSSSTGAATSAAGATTSSSSSMNEKKLKVDTVRMIASSCSE